MHEEFWLARWAQEQIGFHQDRVNPYLVRHWPRLRLPPGTRVLVPLCGKSLDLAWLAAQGHRVLGVELAEKAVRDFFAEQQLQAEVVERGAFRIHRAGALELWCGDFFALTADDLADCVALYDRAALIALPPTMRDAYMAHLTANLAPGCAGLLVTLDYEQRRMEGPPFAVGDAEVRRGLEDAWQVELVQQQDVLEQEWKFLQRGLQRLDERVYLLHKR